MSFRPFFKNTSYQDGCRGRPDTSAASHGFTLIELLVVVSIIALLVSILLPVLGRARLMAKNVVCLSSMRQMGLAVQCYLMESADHLPPSSCHIASANWKHYWLYALGQYTKETLLFRCPGDRTKLPFVDWAAPALPLSSDKRWSSFGYNALLDPITNAGTLNPYNRVSRIPKPQSTIWISEAPITWTNEDHVHPENWFYNIKLAQGQVDYQRHLGQSNFLFLDSHVEHLPLEQTYQWPGPCLWFPAYAPNWPPDE